MSVLCPLLVRRRSDAWLLARTLYEFF
ncbi:hypothetical protein ANCCAN_24963 [Ancylostoma caninum]|uniref:Uncharacterized protein n=1 Tax=Ancylostoma caninum TaxID=29170 RepID=A0A368FGH9_ANCCA|nr:hypothetical protein ANCCAN_24963 [Ancylostoma caninum]